MKRSVFFFLFLFSICIFSQDLFMLYDASFLWGGSKNNPVSGISLNPAFSDHLNENVNFRASWFPGFFGNDNINSLLLALKFEKFSIFLDFTAYFNPPFAMTDEMGEYVTESYHVPSNKKFSLGFSYNVMKGLSASIQYTNYGINLISMDYSSTDHWEETDTYDLMTFGVLYEIRSFLFGISMKYLTLQKEFDDLPDHTQLNIMASGRFLDDKLSINLVSGISFREFENFQFGIGCEYAISVLLLRAGYFPNFNRLSAGLSLGLGIKFKNIDIDYSFMPGELTSHHYLSLGYGLSFKMERAPIAKIERERPKKVEKVKTEPVKRAPPAERVLIAVMDFEGKNIEENDAIIITDFVRHEMINSGFFRVLERGVINQILNEVNFQQTGCTDAECAVEIGKILAVRKMVVGTVSKLGARFFISARMVDVETSEIEASTSIGVDVKIEELPEHVKKLVDEMIGKIK